jgi:hypothetical protein
LLALIFGIIGLVKKSSDKGKNITAVVLGMLSIIITISLQNSWSNAINDTVDKMNEDISEASGDKTEEILENDIEVNLGEFVVVKGEWYDETYMEVVVKNISEERASYSLTIEAVDSNGDKIIEDYVYATNLSSGQSQTIKVFTAVLGDNIEKLKNAKFNIVEASKN